MRCQPWPLRQGRPRLLGVEVTAINVVTPLTWLDFGVVLAHECGHAFLRLSQVPTMDHDPSLEEGICELLALLWLEDQVRRLKEMKRHGEEAKRATRE